MVGVESVTGAVKKKGQTPDNPSIRAPKRRSESCREPGSSHFPKQREFAATDSTGEQTERASLNPGREGSSHWDLPGHVCRMPWTFRPIKVCENQISQASSNTRELERSCRTSGTGGGETVESRIRTDTLSWWIDEPGTRARSPSPLSPLHTAAVSTEI